MSEKDINRITPDVNKGLSSFQVAERQKQGLTNKTKITVGKSLGEIIMTDIFSFFNIVLFIIAGLLIYAEQYTSLFFLMVLIPNIAIGLGEDLYARRLMKKTRIMTSPKAIVIRDGKESEIDTSEIVLDDLVLLKSASQISADGVLLSGSLLVNEALITGESVPIEKHVGDKVLSASYVISGKAYVHMTEVGENTYIEGITKQASKFKRSPSEILASLNKLFRYISIVVSVSAIAMVITSAVQGKFTTAESIKRVIGSISGSLVALIPAGLYLLTSMALAAGVIRLYKKRTAVQELYSIEMLARADVLCVDKTGTITDGSMKLKAILPHNQFSEEQIQQALADLLAATGDDNATALALKAACPFESISSPTRVLTFSSENKYSGATFGSKGTYIMGALEMLDFPSKTGLLKGAEQYATKGYRVIALGYSNKPIIKEKFDDELICMALLVLEDNIKKDCYETFTWFKENGVNVKVISGDNAITVSNIAKTAGVENADKYISLDGVSLDEVKKLVENYNVFGRVSPEQKEVIVETLKANGHTVAMTGDGVNDILALKRADCSIAMASGSEAARNVSHLVLLDSNFNRLPIVVEEGRRVINNIQRTASLFLAKTMFATFFTLFFIIASWFDKTLFYPFSPNHLYIWESIGVGVPAFFVALQPSKDQISGTFFSNLAKKVIPAGMCFILMTLVVFSFYLLRINGFGSFGMNDYPYGNAFEGETAAYMQFIDMAFICLSVFSIAVLVKICLPLDKYRGAVVGVFGTIAIAILGVLAYLGIAKNKASVIFKVDFSILSPASWMISGVILLITITIYYFVTYLFETLRKKEK